MVKLLPKYFPTVEIGMDFFTFIEAENPTLLDKLSEEALLSLKRKNRKISLCQVNA